MLSSNRFSLSLLSPEDYRPGLANAGVGGLLWAFGPILIFTRLLISRWKSQLYISNAYIWYRLDFMLIAVSILYDAIHFFVLQM